MSDNISTPKTSPTTTTMSDNTPDADHATKPCDTCEDRSTTVENSKVVVSKSKKMRLSTRLLRRRHGCPTLRPPRRLERLIVDIGRNGSVLCSSTRTLFGRLWFTSFSTSESWTVTEQKENQGACSSSREIGNNNISDTINDAKRHFVIQGKPQAFKHQVPLPPLINLYFQDDLNLIQYVSLRSASPRKSVWVSRELVVLTGEQ